jgi:hypothetical protein
MDLFNNAAFQSVTSRSFLWLHCGYYVVEFREFYVCLNIFLLNTVDQIKKLQESYQQNLIR